MAMIFTLFILWTILQHCLRISLNLVSYLVGHFKWLLASRFMKVFSFELPSGSLFHCVPSLSKAAYFHCSVHMTLAVETDVKPNHTRTHAPCVINRQAFQSLLIDLGHESFSYF